nr:MFS.9 [Starmerella bombicola]
MGFVFKFERSLKLAFLVSLCWLAQGMGQANFGNSTDLEPFLRHFPSLWSSEPGISKSEKSHRSLIVGLVTAVYELGLAFGGLSTYFVGDRLGRRNTTLLASAFVIIGVVVESSSYQIAQLYVGRVVAGLGIGAFTATVPAWLTETVSAKRRGAFVFLGGGFGITGVATASWICLGMVINQKTHEVAWRLPLAVQGIVAAIVTFATFFLDESPRTLLRHNKPEEALRIMRKYRNESELRFVEEEYREMVQAYKNETLTMDRNPWRFNQHKQFRRTVSAIVLSGLCQMSGINLITFYGSRIFQQIGLSTVRSRVALAGLQTWQALCAFAAIWFVTKFGRRKLVLGGSATMCICFCCCAGLDSSSNQSTRYGILAFDAIQLAAFPIGLFLNPFLIGSEISGLLCRSAVLACVSFTNWAMNFVLALVTPLGFDNLGYKYYTVYVCTNAALFVFAYLFIPDTSGLTVEEVDQAYVNSKNPFDIVKCAEAVRQAGHVPPEILQASKDEQGSVNIIEYTKDDTKFSRLSF